MNKQVIITLIITQGKVAINMHINYIITLKLLMLNEVER